MKTPLIIKSFLSVIAVMLIGVLSCGLYVSSKVDLKKYMECIPAYTSIAYDSQYKFDNPLPVADIQYSETALEAMSSIVAHRKAHPDTPDDEFFLLVESGLIEATNSIFNNGQCWAESEARFLAVELQRPEYSHKAKELADSILNNEKVINHPFVQLHELINNPMIPRPIFIASLYVASTLQGVDFTQM